MSLTSSLAAFGLRPATTSTANQQQQQQPTTTSFANAPPLGQNQPQTSNAFSPFGQNQQNSLFGQPQQQQQPQQTQQSVFGQPQQPQQPTGSLFGQPQTQSQPLFGQSQQPQQPQQQQQGTNIFGNPLFGTSTTTNTQQPQQNAFGIFGGGQQQQQQQQPQQNSFFGSANPLQTQPTLPSGAFGSIATTGSFGGGSTLFGGKSQTQQQLIGQSGQGVNLTQPSPEIYPFTKNTKFNELPDSVKKVIEGIDTYIQDRIQISKDLQQRKLADQPTKGFEAIRNLNMELIETVTTIRNDIHLTKDLKAKVNQAVVDTIVATRIIDAFRNPQSGNSYLKDHATFPLEYFTRVTDLMRERLSSYLSTIEQIERKLTTASQSAQSPQSISATLQAQHATFLALASKTAGVDAEIQKIKALYTQLWRTKTGSFRDPFNDIVKPSEAGNDLGLSGLNVR